MQMSEEPELTFEQRAILALGKLAVTYPAAENVALGEAEIPEWMAQPWLPQLTDPNDPQFVSAVIKAEAWLSNRGHQG